MKTLSSLQERKPLKHMVLQLFVLIIVIFVSYYSYIFLQGYLSNKNLELKIKSNISINDKQLLLLNSPVRGYLHPKVEDYLKQHKVFISLTTSPQRIKYLTEVFSTLDLRNVEAILLALPKVFGRTGEHYVVPKALVKAYPKLHILQVEKDLGPITKLLPAVEYARKTDPQAMVVTIDDDTLYPFGMINDMIHYVVLNNSIVGAESTNVGGTGELEGIDMHNYPWQKNNATIVGFIKNFVTTNILENILWVKKKQFINGYGGVAYRVDWVDKDRLLKLSQLTKECFQSDDMVISYVLNVGNVPIVKIGTNYYNRHILTQLNYGFMKDALHSIQPHKDKYFSCYQSMLQYDHINNPENTTKILRD